MPDTGQPMPLLRLAPVAPGAAIRVLSPASYADPARVERGLAQLRSLGFQPALGPHAQTRGPLYFAGTPAERRADLHAAFADPQSRIVACVRGGYGSNYLLPRLDLGIFRAHPKPFFAYSDLTGIQLHLLDQLGLPAFHGPMVAADFARDDGVHLASFHSALAGRPYTLGASEGLRTLTPGAATGTLYGGCLSILVSLLGTPWEPATQGKLLFLEDTGARPFQIDRMLWQLRHAGKLRDVPGIVFGEMLDCASPGTPPDLLDQAIRGALAGLRIPIAIGLRSGHVSRHNVTLTFGVHAELHATEDPQLRLLEPAVSQ